METESKFYEPTRQLASTSKPTEDEDDEEDEEEVAETLKLTKKDLKTKKGPYTITEDELAHRFKHKNRGQYIPQALIILIVCLGALFFGLYLKWSDPLHRVSEFTESKISKVEYGYIISLIPCGCFVGIAPWSYIVGVIGPKRTLVIQGPLYCLSFFILSLYPFAAFTSFNLFTRFLSGLFSIPVLLGGECLLLDTIQRGYFQRMIVFFRSAIPFGILLSFLMKSYVHEHLQKLIIFGVIISFTVLLAILPESPVFLYMKSKKKAVRALKWYKGTRAAYTELKYVKREAEIRKIGIEPYIYMFSKEVVYKGFFIVFGLVFFQVFSGYFIFIFYQFMFWDETDEKTDYNKIVIYLACLYIASFVGAAIHNRLIFSIRKTLLLSTILISIHLTILTVFTFLHIEGFIEKERWEWIQLYAINTFVISYEVGLGAYPEILLNLYLPYRITYVATSVIRTSYWLQIFLLTRYYLLVCSLVPHFIILAILTVISYLSIFFCYTFVVETKNKTFLQVQRLIGGTPIGSRRGYTNNYCKPEIIL